MMVEILKTFCNLNLFQTGILDLWLFPFCLIKIRKSLSYQVLKRQVSVSLQFC